MTEKRAVAKSWLPDWTVLWFAWPKGRATLALQSQTRAIRGDSGPQLEPL